MDNYGPLPVEYTHETRRRMFLYNKNIVQKCTISSGPLSTTGLATPGLNFVLLQAVFRAKKC